MARSERSSIRFPALRRILVWAAPALLVLLAASCDSGSSSVFDGERTFWAVDFTTDNAYKTRALPVLHDNGATVGENCYVYVEVGQAVDDAAAKAVAAYFDNVVYPSLRAAFGEEPNPDGRMDNIIVGDADRDRKIYLLLMDIRDGYRPELGGAVRGYFDKSNEMPGEFKAPSNRKEILFLDTNPSVIVERDSTGAALIDNTGLPVLTESFRRNLAHQFQHMIHWEQKTNRVRLLLSTDVVDDPWLDEAMSTVAPAYCGLGIDREQLAVFETFPTTSLVAWPVNPSARHSAVAYAWGEFLLEHCGDAVYYDNSARRLSADNVFLTILGNNRGGNPYKGIQSVNMAFTGSFNNDLAFQRLFRNWSLACLYGDGSHAPVVPPDSTTAYLLLDTWRSVPEGTWSLDNAGLLLLGFLNEHAPLNRNPLPALDPWSFAVWRYDNDLESSLNTGTVRWVPIDNSHSASFVDGGDGTLYPEAVRDNAYAYTNQAWLVVRNNQDVPIPKDNVVPLSAARALSLPAGVLDDPGARTLLERTGKPFGVCVQPRLLERARRLSASPSP